MQGGMLMMLERGDSYKMDPRDRSICYLGLRWKPKGGINAVFPNSPRSTKCIIIRTI